MLTKYQLKNGLTVLFVPSSKAPVVSVQMWVRTGSRDEQRGEEGLSHFIEHLVFKGTHRYGVGEIAQTVEGAGGELNAYTSFDQTVFYVTIASRYHEVAFDVISQMMGFPTFDPEETDREREVVLEEIKRGEDSVGRRASQLLFKTAYAKSNYRKPVIGFAKNIKSVSAKKIKDYFQRRYHPENMFLVVTGDLDRKTSKEKIKHFFEGIPRQKKNQIKPPKELVPNKPRIKVEKTNFAQSIAYLAWHIPTSKHKDIPALDVAAFILGQGESSRLYRALRLDHPLVKSVSVGNYLPIENGLAMISLNFEPREFSRAISTLTHELGEFLREGPTAIELERAKLNIQSGEYFGMETVDGLARKFGSAEFQFRDPNAFDKYFKDLERVTAADVQRVIKKYFLPEGLCIAISSPEEISESKNWAKSITREWKKKYHNASQNLRRPKTKKLSSKPFKFKPTAHSPQTEVMSLQNGVRIVVRPSLDSAVISCRAAAIGGSRLESTAGLCELMGRNLMSGTRHRTEKELTEALDDLGGQLGPVIGRNTTGLSLDVLKQKESFGLELFLDVLTSPIFESSCVEREKIFQIDQIKKKNDNPTQVAFQAFHELMYAGHPFARDSLGTETSLASLSHEKILKEWMKTIKPQRLIFSICGPFDKTLWLEEIEKTFGTKKSSSQISIDPLDLPPITKSQQKHILLRKEQSHIVIGYRSHTLFDQEKYTLQVMQAILAGQGGRLFLELRDKESLAYSVSPLRAEGLEPGYFGAYIGCSPEKQEKAVKMLREELAKLAEYPVTKEELLRAQNYLIGRHEIELQRTSHVSANMLYDTIYGIPLSEIFNYGEHVSSVTSEQIMMVAKQIFSRPEVLVQVGPE